MERRGRKPLQKSIKKNSQYFPVTSFVEKAIEKMTTSEKKDYRNRIMLLLDEDMRDNMPKNSSIKVLAERNKEIEEERGEYMARLKVIEEKIENLNLEMERNAKKISEMKK